MGTTIEITTSNLDGISAPQSGALRAILNAPPLKEAYRYGMICMPVFQGARCRESWEGGWLMGTALRWANDGLAFFLELAALAALCYWGVTTGSGVLLKAVLGIGAPLTAAFVWGLFAAPRATFAVPLIVVLLVKAVVFGTATLALYATGHRATAAIFAVLVVANTIVITTVRHSNAG